MDDKQLLEMMKSGNDAAFRVVFDKYWPDLFQLAYKRLRCSAEASDMVQEVFLSLLKTVHKIEIADSLAPYLFISLRNKIFNHYEKQSVRLKYLLRQAFEPVISEEAIISAIQNKELQRVITEEVAKMPDRMREIYLLSREQMMDTAGIAGLLLLSPQTVKNQLHRALERIRQALHARHLHKFSNFL